MTDTAQPTGRCYCGCGREIGYGRFFVTGHDKTAEAAFLAVHHNASIAQMLHAHGYGPQPEKSVTKAAVDEEVWRDCPFGCGYRGARESINDHVDRHHRET
jgi:hypothetical protein